MKLLIILVQSVNYYFFFLFLEVMLNSVAATVFCKSWYNLLITSLKAQYFHPKATFLHLKFKKLPINPTTSIN